MSGQEANEAQMPTKTGDDGEPKRVAEKGVVVAQPCRPIDGVATPCRPWPSAVELPSNAVG